VYHSTRRIEIGKHEIGIESGCYCGDATLTPSEEAHGSGALMAKIEEKEVPMPLEHTDVRASVSGYIGAAEVTQ